jgi:hypothetical protein
VVGVARAKVRDEGGAAFRAGAGKGGGEAVHENGGCLHKKISLAIFVPMKTAIQAELPPQLVSAARSFVAEG